MLNMKIKAKKKSSSVTRVFCMPILAILKREGLDKTPLSFLMNKNLEKRKSNRIDSDIFLSPRVFYGPRL